MESIVERVITRKLYKNTQKLHTTDANHIIFGVVMCGPGSKPDKPGDVLSALQDLSKGDQPRTRVLAAKGKTNKQEGGFYEG